MEAIVCFCDNDCYIIMDTDKQLCVNIPVYPYLMYFSSLHNPSKSAETICNNLDDIAWENNQDMWQQGLQEIVKLERFGPS